MEEGTWASSEDLTSGLGLLAPQGSGQPVTHLSPSVTPKIGILPSL